MAGRASARARTAALLGQQAGSNCNLAGGRMVSRKGSPSSEGLIQEQTGETWRWHIGKMANVNGGTNNMPVWAEDGRIKISGR